MMLRFALLLIFIVTLTSCGTVGPVKPLLKTLPQAVDNATLQQKGAALLLAWNIPTHNQDGSELSDLAGFAVYKVDYELDGCPDCRVPKTLLRKIDLAYYRSSNRSSKRIYLWDSVVDEEMGYRYKIVPYTTAGLDGEAVLINRACFTVPFAPDEVVAIGLDQQVRLKWQAADNVRQGVELVGYNIYRRSGSSYFAPQPVNKKPITVAVFNDMDVKNGTEYGYAVRSVIAIDGQQLESSFSAKAMVTPHRPE